MQCFLIKSLESLLIRITGGDFKNRGAQAACETKEIRLAGDGIQVVSAENQSSHEKQYSCPLLIHHFTFCSFSYMLSIRVWTQMILLLTNRQKVCSRLALHHNAYVAHLTSSHQVGILSFHIFTKRRVGTV